MSDIFGVFTNGAVVKYSSADKAHDSDAFAVLKTIRKTGIRFVDRNEEPTSLEMGKWSFRLLPGNNRPRIILEAEDVHGELVKVVTNSNVELPLGNSGGYYIGETTKLLMNIKEVLSFNTAKEYKLNQRIKILENKISTLTEQLEKIRIKDV